MDVVFKRVLIAFIILYHEIVRYVFVQNLVAFIHVTYTTMNWCKFYIVHCRYEWSVGYADKTTPQGFYDPVEDKVWQEAGQLMDSVFTIGQGKNNVSISLSLSFISLIIVNSPKCCWFMVINATFNDISVTSLWSVLLVEETGENHRPVTSHWQTYNIT